MTDEIMAPITTLLVGLLFGFALGRDHRAMLDKIRTLQEGREPEPEPEIEPVITRGILEPAKAVSGEDGRDVGLVDPKTPQRVNFEAEQAIEREARGIKAT